MATQIAMQVSERKKPVISRPRNCTDCPVHPAEHRCRADECEEQGCTHHDDVVFHVCLLLIDQLALGYELARQADAVPSYPGFDRGILHVVPAHEGFSNADQIAAGHEFLAGDGSFDIREVGFDADSVGVHEGSLLLIAIHYLLLTI